MAFKHYAQRSVDRKTFDSAKNANNELALDNNDGNAAGGIMLQGDGPNADENMDTVDIGSKNNNIDGGGGPRRR